MMANAEARRARMKKYSSRSLYLPLGVVVAGTTATGSLVQAFLSLADGVRMRAPDRVTVNKILRRFDPDNSDLEVALDDMIDLEDVLAAYAPPYAYFGVSESDDSVWGVWPDWVRIEEDVKEGRLAAGRHRARLGHRFAVDSDGRSTTLWKRLTERERRSTHGGRWKSVWKFGDEGER